MKLTVILALLVVIGVAFAAPAPDPETMGEAMEMVAPAME